MITQVVKNDTNAEESVFKKFQSITNAISFCARFVGAEITDPDFKMSWWTYNVICVCSMFLLCTGYTVYVGVVIDGDWLVLVQSACQGGAAIQGSAKLFCVLMYRK